MTNPLTNAEHETTNDRLPEDGGNVSREGTSRIHGFDALRAIALLLGLVIHAAMPYMQPAVEIWPVVEPHGSFGYTLFVVTVHAFRMQTFFLLAGFFSALLVVKRGWSSFIANRTSRIVFPFLLSVLILVPIMQIEMIWGYFGRASAGYFKMENLVVDNRAYHQPIATFFTSGDFVGHMFLYHLWFLFYLILIYLLFAVSGGLVAVVSKVTWGRQTIACFQTGLNQMVASRWSLAWLPLVSGFAMLPMHFWQVDTPTKIIPDLVIVGYYTFFFLIGVVLYQLPEKIAQLKQEYGYYLAGAIVVYPLMLMLQANGPNVQEEPYRESLEPLAVWVYSVFTWCMVFGLVGGFAKWFDRSSRRFREISDSAYWQYLLHLPLLFALQLVLIQFSLPSLLEVALQVFFTYFVLLWSFRYLVRGSWVEQMLNGRRS